MPETPFTVRAQVIAGVRQLIVAVVTAGVILTVLIVGFRSQGIEERRVREDQLNVSLATVCVLALPVDEDGRDPADVQACFTQYGLTPPQIVR